MKEFGLTIWILYVITFWFMGLPNIESFADFIMLTFSHLFLILIPIAIFK